MVTRLKVRMANLDTVDLHEVARYTGISLATITKVRDGIKAVKESKRQTKTPPPEGGISIGKASRKYGIPDPTISRWKNKGIIPVLLETRNEIYIDEAIAAKVIAEFKKNPGQGKKTVLQFIQQAPEKV